MLVYSHGRNENTSRFIDFYKMLKYNQRVNHRHEKSSKPSADAILGYLKFPQIETSKFPQKPIN